MYLCRVSLKNTGMKKLLFSMIMLAGAVCMVACSKDKDSNPSEEQLVNAFRTDWAKESFYGSPKKVVEVHYAYSGFVWDTVAGKPVTPTKVSNTNVSDFNSAGYLLLKQRTNNVVTGAKTISGDRIVVTQTEQRPESEVWRTYDGKNRELTYKYLGYDYTTTYAGQTIDGSYYVNDTFPYMASNSDPIVVRCDTTYGSKAESVYDDAAKIVTTISYRLLLDGTWKADDKVVATLNQYGFTDDNSTIFYYDAKTTAAQFEDKPNYVNYRERDPQGNWRLYYSYGYDNATGRYSLYDYQTRDILYY